MGKRNSTTLFDVTMGSYDGAETCELVGCYLLSQLKEVKTTVKLIDTGSAVLRCLRWFTRQAAGTVMIFISEKQSVDYTIEKLNILGPLLRTVTLQPL